MTHVVDAHALIWYLENNVRLGPNAKRVLLAAVDADPRLGVYALDQAVIERTTAPDVAVIAEMHDRQIVATALLVAGRGEPVARLTHDGDITNAGLVPVV